MAYARPAASSEIAEMNITPLVDVMLVMLVIFMISAPIFTQAIPVNVSRGDPPQPPIAVEPIDLRIDAVGDVYMDDRLVPLSALSSLLSAEAVRAGEMPPVVEVEASGDAEYEVVAKVLASAQNAGLDKIRFMP
jgi:biopolymer transport protein ExbD